MRVMPVSYVSSAASRMADIANLAAALTIAMSSVQLIHSIDDFPTANVVACVLNNSVHMNFLRINYPNITVHARQSHKPHF